MILDEILEILKSKSSNKAYTVNNKTYTYFEFYKIVCNIYNYITENYEDAKKIVVFGHKEIYTKAAYLACSFAGKTYIPIDSFFPEERINSIIKQANPDLIIGNIHQSECANISIEKIEELINRKDYKEIDNITLKENDVYYIIFTSGSTGIHKGVKVAYRNLNSCVKWLKEISNINKSVILNQANFSFDLSVADLYLSLITESEHFILESNKLDFNVIFEQLRVSNTEIAVMTPSFAELLLLDKNFNCDLMKNLKQIFFCGEKLLNSTVKKLFVRFPELKIVNFYGPTECTFAVSSVEITKESFDDSEISIGKAKSGVEIKIVDEDFKELEEECIGEILIAGDSVSDGYLNVENKSFIKYNDKNAYLTGDLGYYKNGMLYYTSRKDSQIKYKGYRIELLDIENNLYNLNIFERVEVAALKDDNDTITKIIAFVKILENNQIDIFEIKKKLRKVLPEYMCPVIKVVNEFPINGNGKCDKKELLKRYKNGK